MAEKDKEVAKKDAAIDDLKGKVLDAEALDKRVADRADLLAKAATSAKDVKATGLSDADIRKAVVSAKLGDTAVTGKHDAYIEARFDMLAEDAAKGDGFAAVAIPGITGAAAGATVADKAYMANVTSMTDAWKAPSAQKEA